MSSEMEVGPADVQDGAEMLNGDIDADEAADGLGELSNDIATRPIHKAKRTLGRRSPGKELGPVANRGDANKTVPIQSKNSKKSRDGRGRGLPKKGLHVVCLLWL